MTPTVHLRLIGRFGVFLGGRQLAEREIASRKGRLLLKLLAAHRGRVVPVDRILETVWGSEPPRHPDENVAVLVSRLRNVLGREHIEGGRGGYLLRTGPACSVDIDDAERLLDRARTAWGRGEDTEARTAVETALAVLETGELLEDEPYADWAHAGRLAYRRLLRAARYLAGSAAVARGEPERALLLAEAAVADDPLDEEAHRLRMSALHGMGEPGRALAAYEELRSLLADELGADPSRDTQVLHLAILRGEEPAAAVHPPPGHRPDRPVGRERELDALRKAWEGALSSGPRLLLVLGEAGIGKSTLADTFAAEVERSGALVVSGRCFELERSMFLQPVVDGLGLALVRAGEQHLIADLPPEHGRVLAGLVPELRDLFGHDPLAEPVSAEAARRRSFGALSALLSGVSRRRPVLLAIDDLHEAGESTLEFLHWFVRTGRGRILVLALARAEDRGRIEGLSALAGMLELRGLGEPDVARVAARAGFPDAAAELWQLTKGHPLYLREGLDALRETGALTASTSLRQAIQARARRAGPEVAEFLRAASVVGTVVDVDLVSTLVSREPAWGARLGEQGLRRGFLEESGSDYSFRHEILRRALYAEVPLPTRVAWHRQIAEALQRRGEREEAVGHHAARGEVWDLAARSYLEAGRKAASSFANREAERLLGEAVAASSRASDTGLRGAILLERGRVRVLLDDYEGADADLHEVLVLARQSKDASLETSALEQLVWSAYMARRLSAAAGYLNDVLASVRTPSLLTLSGRVHHALGHLAAAEREGSESLERAEALGDGVGAAYAASHLGSLAAHRDQYERAASLLEEAEASGRRLGLFRAVFSSLHFRGLALGNLGELASALEAFERLRREGSETEARHYEGRALNGQAWMWLELGELSRAKDLAEEAHACSGDEFLAEPRANALLLLAEVALRCGDVDASRALVAQADALGIPAAYGWRFELRSLELRARVAALDGRHEELAARLTEAARQRGVPKYESLGLALTGRQTEACAIARRLGSDLLVARVGMQEEARAAVDRMARRLPPGLRERFARRRP